jgi:hypothetical protein
LCVRVCVGVGVRACVFSMIKTNMTLETTVHMANNAD